MGETDKTCCRSCRNSLSETRLYHTVETPVHPDTQVERDPWNSSGMTYGGQFLQTYMLQSHYHSRLKTHLFRKVSPPYFFYLPPTGLTSRISAVLFVFSGMSVSTLVLCARLSWPSAIRCTFNHCTSPLSSHYVTQDRRLRCKDRQRRHRLDGSTDWSDNSPLEFVRLAKITQYTSGDSDVIC